MNGTSLSPGPIRIDVYGVSPRSTIAQVMACAKASACCFEASKKTLGAPSRRLSGLPIQLGTLYVDPKTLPDLSRHLADLAKKKAKKPFGCKIEGRLIDLTWSVTGIRREISRFVNMSDGNKRSPRIVEATLVHATKTRAAPGPHNLEVST